MCCGLQYKPQDRWIFRYRQCIYTQQMEEIKYGREKHRKPRPEMGTPEYEEWRKRMLQRRRERLKRERRKRLIAIGVAAVLIAGGVSAGAIALSNRFASGSDRKVVTSDTKKKIKRKREQTPAKQFLQRLPVIHPVIQFPAILWRRRIFWLSSMIMIKPLIF